MGGAMLSKSFIQFSVDWGAMFPPCYLPGSKLWWTSLVAQPVKHLPTMWETWVQSLGWEDPLEKEMTTHSSTLAWKIPWMEKLVGYGPWGRKESDMSERDTSLH